MQHFKCINIEVKQRRYGCENLLRGLDQLEAKANRDLCFILVSKNTIVWLAHGRGNGRGGDDTNDY